MLTPSDIRVQLAETAAERAQLQLDEPGNPIPTGAEAGKHARLELEKIAAEVDDFICLNYPEYRREQQ